MKLLTMLTMVFEDVYSTVTNQANSASSSLGFKYSSLRDYALHSSRVWLDGKREDDGAEGLWRIHDGLYDLKSFIGLHPGGPSWIYLTRGTDITEAFEVHHLSAVPEKLLSKYFVRKASTPRNSPFRFEENGFYKTLKRNVQEALNDVPEWPVTRSKVITDTLLGSYLLFCILAAYSWSFTLGIIAGLFLNLTAIAAHNYFHKKDNMRMYYFDFTLMGSNCWRVSHALSHHMYTNTINDMEIASLEPFFQYLPGEKTYTVRYLSWLYSPFVYMALFFVFWLTELIQCIKRRRGFVPNQFLPLVVPLLIYTFTTLSIFWTFFMYTWILVWGSLFFGIVGLNAAHHHPDIFHDGDTPRPKEELDWGVYQMDAVMDRNEMTGSHFLVLTNFGDHTLHHLFPTIDHGLLEYLYPAFKKTCEQFGIEFRVTSQLDLIIGQFKQLAKIEPSPKPPKPLRRQTSK